MVVQGLRTPVSNEGLSDAGRVLVGTQALDVDEDEDDEISVDVGVGVGVGVSVVDDEVDEELEDSLDEADAEALEELELGVEQVSITPGPEMGTTETSSIPKIIEASSAPVDTT